MSSDREQKPNSAIIETRLNKFVEYVKELERIEKDYDDARATILVNFGPDGHQVSGLVNEDMSLVGMVVHLAHKIKDLQERLYDGG